MRYTGNCLFTAVIILLSFFTECTAQEKEKKNKERTLSSATLNDAYSLAIDIRDYSSAQLILIDLLSLDKNDTATVFKLVELYFVQKKFESCYLLSKKYLEQYRDNITLLDYYAKSSEVLSKFTEALAAYEKAYLLTDDAYYGYLAANAEFVLGRQKECLVRVEELFLNKTSNTTFVTFDMGNEKTQNVIVMAALYNLKAQLLKANGDSEGSKIALSKALELVPDFELAKQNLLEISK